jgi:putative ABC transport system permease protein
MTVITAVLVAAVTIVLTVPQFMQVRGSDPRAGLEGMGHAANRRGLVKQALVTVQIALSIGLVAAGVGLVRTVTRLTDLDPGFRADGVLTFGLNPSNRFGTGPAMLQFYRSALEEIRRIPGVRSAAAAVAVPLTSSAWQFGIRPDPNAPEVLVAVNLVTTQYFDTLGIPVRAGRVFSDEEERSSSSVAVVNDALARLIAPGGAAVGRDFRYSGEPWRVIGIVGSARQRRLREPPMPELFIPWNQAARQQTIVVRADGDPLRLVPAIAACVQTLDSSAPLGNPTTLDRRLSEARRAETFRASLVAALATLAVALAAFGAYGVTAFSVARRTREFGIRAALGESRRSIAGRAIWTAGAPAVYGAMLGAAAALVSAQWLNGFMYETNAREWTTVVGATVGVVAVSLGAAARCARSAARTSPVDALRIE